MGDLSAPNLRRIRSIRIYRNLIVINRWHDRFKPPQKHKKKFFSKRLQKNFVNPKRSTNFALGKTTWYHGRVVRHRSAKPSTAVRFCLVPQLKLNIKYDYRTSKRR